MIIIRPAVCLGKSSSLLTLQVSRLYIKTWEGMDLSAKVLVYVRSLQMTFYIGQEDFTKTRLLLQHLR